MSSSHFFRRLSWILALYLVEVTFAPRFGSFSPPLVLAAVIGIAIEGGAGAGLLWGAAAGILFEPFASGPIGAVSLAYALAGWTTGVLSTKMFGESFWVRGVWPCAALAVAAAVEASWGRPAESSTGFWEAWFAAVPPQRFLMTALVTPWIAARLRPAERTARPRRARPLYS